MKTGQLVVFALACLVREEAVHAQDPVKLSPSLYTVLLENAQVRVLEYRPKPGDREPMHFHPAAVVHALSDTKARATTPDGKAVIVESKAGQIIWSDAVTHAWEHLGPGDGRVVIVEMKGPADASGQGTSSFSSADAAALRARGDAYVQAFRGSDWAAWVDFYVPDAEILPPNAPVVRGRAAMMQWARALPPIASFTRTSDEVQVSGDLAYLRGGYQLVLSPPGGPAITDAGKYLQIWRKQAGTWRVARAIFSSDLPAPVARP